jgi:hypothetical protein
LFFSFSDVPPGNYYLIFKLHGESRYQYFVKNWRDLEVKPGEMISEINYRLTSQDANHLIDELVVEFPNDVPQEKVLSYIKQLNCHLTSKPLDMLTTFYYINIPDDKTVDEVIEEFKQFPKLKSVSRQEVAPTRRLPIEGEAILSVWEEFASASEQDKVLLKFNFRTEKVYPCSNYRLRSRIEKQGSLISIAVPEVNVGGLCLTTMGPAGGSEKLFLPFGGYNIVFEYANTIEKYWLGISEASISLRSADPSSKSVNTRLWRRPEHSLVYLCGTTIKTSWMCEDFINTVRRTVDLKEIHFPDSGKTLYPSQSGGYNYDMPARFFLYSQEEDYETLGKLLEDYTENTISSQNGIGLSLMNWRNKQYRSWLYD